VEVWFDEDIKSGEYPQHRIQDRLRNTSVFVAIVSPSYLESRYCRDLELDFFLNQGGRGQDVIQLVKVPLARPERDVPLPDAKWVPLYNQSDLRELTGKRLERALIKPVIDIQNRLIALWEACPKVFLAQIEADALARPWNQFKEALKDEGFAVLPNNIRLTDRRLDLIEDNIERAAISIHLAPLREDALASRQLEIAKRVGKPLVLFDRPPDAGDMRSAIETIHATLNTPRPPAVYFVYDDYSDGKRVHALQDQIRIRTGFEVLTPQAGEKYHKYRLMTSDGILVFRCEAPDEWFHAQQQKLRQCVGLRLDRTAPVACYLAGRPHRRSEEVRGREAESHWTIGMIETAGEPDISDLQPFIDAMKVRGESRSRANV
jgi:hypothetical protein